MAPLAPLASDPWRCTPPALAENQPGRALLLHTAPALTPEQAQPLAASGVPAVEGEVAELVIANGRVSGLCLRTVEITSREIVVAAPVVQAHANLLRVFVLEAEPLEAGGQVIASRGRLSQPAALASPASGWRATWRTPWARLSLLLSMACAPALRSTST